MSKLFIPKCPHCKHDIDQHSKDGSRCRGFFDADHKPIPRQSIKAGMDGCSWRLSRNEIEKAAALSLS
jgi:hypothetical protein